jgi:uncharacterized membrane protein (DUF4010 family)
MIASPWLNLAVALALGMLIGLERERSKGGGDGAERRPAGIRTFTIATLLGATAQFLGGTTLLMVASASIALLAAVAYALEEHAREAPRGITTEVGLIAAPLLGGLAIVDPSLAAGLGVSVAVVFAAKMPLHHFVRHTLTETEVRDGLLFAVATLVIWPQLPDQNLGPFSALNPHRIWLLVVLVMALGACGHIATRALGARYGLTVAGLAAGFVSSTAALTSMAERAKRDPASMQAALAGASLATVGSLVILGVLVFTISRPTLIVLGPALGAGVVAAAVSGLVQARRAIASTGNVSSDRESAFSVLTALGLAGLMAVTLVAAAALKAWLGNAGVLAGATLAGVFDAHSSAISIASLVASGQLSPGDAVVPIFAGLTANQVTKIAIASGAGPPGFMLRFLPGMLAMLAATWAVALLPIWRR